MGIIPIKVQLGQQYCKCYIKGIMTEEMKAEYERLLKQLEVVQQLESEIKKKLIIIRNGN